MKPYFERFAALAKHEAFTCDVSYSFTLEPSTSHGRPDRQFGSWLGAVARVGRP